MDEKTEQGRLGRQFRAIREEAKTWPAGMKQHDQGMFPPMSTGPTDLSRRLQRLLDDRGLSIAEAARMAGIEKQRAWLVVTGRNDNPTWRTITRLVEGVGGSMRELFGEKE